MQNKYVTSVHNVDDEHNEAVWGSSEQQDSQGVNTTKMIRYEF